MQSFLFYSVHIHQLNTGHKKTIVGEGREVVPKIY